jgi:hypothetical protein
MPLASVLSRVGGKRVSAACVSLGSVFTKTLLYVPTNFILKLVDIS